MFEDLLTLVPWVAIPLFLAGFGPLIKGADWLVEGGSALAARFKVPPLVIGLTIVAFGTSAPELVVNVFAATGGNTDLALGNIVGSNLFNILTILGLSALVRPIVAPASTAWVEIPLVLVAALAVGFLGLDTVFSGASTGQSLLSRGDGLILLLFFSLFLGYTVFLALRGDQNEAVSIQNWSRLKASVFVLVGLFLLVVGGKMIVESAVVLARGWGLSERVIGLTVVSIGTSLPELATSLVAARKGNSAIALGNIVGSNLFNTFLVLGLTAVVAPIPVSTSSIPDLALNAATSLLLLGFVWGSKKRQISRIKGSIFVVLYGVYTGWLLVA